MVVVARVRLRSDGKADFGERVRRAASAQLDDRVVRPGPGSSAGDVELGFDSMEEGWDGVERAATAISRALKCQAVALYAVGLDFEVAAFDAGQRRRLLRFESGLWERVKGEVQPWERSFFEPHFQGWADVDPSDLERVLEVEYGPGSAELEAFRTQAVVQGARAPGPVGDWWERAVGLGAVVDLVVQPAPPRVVEVLRIAALGLVTLVLMTAAVVAVALVLHGLGLFDG